MAKEADVAVGNIGRQSRRWPRWWCHVPAAIAAILLCLLVMAFTWRVFFRPEVMSYGDPREISFVPATATEGDEIELCFNDVVWHKVCASRLVTHLTPARGPRLDLPSYAISAPPEAGRVPPKCRKWQVPLLGRSREPGPAVLSGFAESRCSYLDLFHPIYTPLPPVKIKILRRNP